MAVMKTQNKQDARNPIIVVGNIRHIKTATKIDITEITITLPNTFMRKALIGNRSSILRLYNLKKRHATLIKTKIIKTDSTGAPNFNAI